MSFIINLMWLSGIPVAYRRRRKTNGIIVSAFGAVTWPIQLGEYLARIAINE